MVESSNTMRVCVIGAGAVGGHIAGRLGAAQMQTSVLARGAQLAAIRDHGLHVHTDSGVIASHPFATDNSKDLPPQDIVIVAVKAHSLPSVAEQLKPMLTTDARVLFVTNGIPWWYFSGTENESQLPRLDPGGSLREIVGHDRTIGGVAYTAGTVIAPGVVRAENAKNRLVIGRPDGRPDSRLDRFAAALKPSGLEVSVTGSIRDAVWSKLLSNIIGGSLGALTNSAGKDALSIPAIASVAAGMAEEIVALAGAYGHALPDSATVLEKLATSHHLQSIAQDLLSERPMEIDALFRAPLDLAAIANVPTPRLDLILGLVIQRATAAGLYHDAQRT